MMRHPSARSLHQATFSGRDLELRQALAAGSHPDRYQWEAELRMTPLHAACHHGHLECARVLLEAGANPELAVEVVSRPLVECHNGFTSWQMALALRGKRPLELAMPHGPGFARLLLSYGARPTHELHEAMLAGDPGLQARAELAVQRRAMRLEWGHEAVRLARQSLDSGELARAWDCLREARRLLGDERYLLDLWKLAEDRERLEQLKPCQVEWECRRRLRLEPTSRIWLRPLLERQPEQFPRLLQELAGLLSSLGMDQPLPAPERLSEGLDELPDCCIGYLSRRLAGE